MQTSNKTKVRRSENQGAVRTLSKFECPRRRVEIGQKCAEALRKGSAIRKATAGNRIRSWFRSINAQAEQEGSNRVCQKLDFFVTVMLLGDTQATNNLLW